MITLIKQKVWGTLLALTLTSFSLAETVTIATTTYAPYLYKEKDGLSQEITRAALKAVDIDVKFESFPLVRLIKYFEHKKINHALFVSDSFSDLRKFNRVPIHNVLSVLAYNNSIHKNLDFNDLSDLAGLKVGTTAGDEYYIDMFRKAGLIPLTVHNPEQNMAKLAKGRIDVADFTYLTARFLKKEMLINSGSNISIIPTRLAKIPLVLISGKGGVSDELNKKMSDGLNIIKKNGQYIAILEKYFGEGSVPKDVFIGV